MDFVEWLSAQNTRTDDIGWLSRLVESSTESKDELKKFAGRERTYVVRMPDSKIQRTMAKAVSEWQKSVNECQKTASRPQVGIFWIIDGDVVPFLTDASTVNPVGIFKDGPYDHYREWDKVARAFPAVARRGYDEVPRGRVIGVKDGFRIFVSPVDAKNQVQIRQIMNAFSLPFGKTEVMADEHYVTQKHIEGIDDDVDPFDSSDSVDYMRD